MKRSKKIIALAAVLVIVCVATFALTRYEEKQEEIKNTDAVILEIPTDTVEALSWEFVEDGFAFHKSENGWFYDEDDAFPVSEDKINDILANFEAFGAAFIIENVEDYSQYGLDDPEGTIHLTTAEQSYAIKLGDFSKMDEQRYVDIGDGNVYLVSNDPMEFLETALSSMIEHDDTPGFENVVDITFSGSENYTVVKTEDSPNTYNTEDIYFAQLDGEELPLDTVKIIDYLNTVTTLDLLNYATYNATEEELKRYGLDEPELTVSVNYSFTEYADEDDEDGTKVYDTCVFYISQDPEELVAYEEELDISGLQSALTELSADSFTDETPSEKEEINLIIYLDNENFPKVKIQLYRYDGSFCLAMVDGESVSLVDRGDVMELVEAVQAIVLN